MESLDENVMGRMHILPIHDRWRMLAMGVGISLALQAGSSLLKAMKISALVERINQGDSGAAYELNSMTKSVDPFTAIAGLVGIVAIVFVCMWFYRAGQNIHLAGLKYLNYTPGWYVGWFFIPLVQIVMPFITSIELWKASSSINHQQDHSSWNSNKLSPLVILWYVTFLIVLAIMFYAIGSNFDDARRMQFDPDAAVRYVSNMSKIPYFTIPLQVISGICLILFSKKISDMQTNYINGSNE